MQLSHKFFRLPIRIDHRQVALEISSVEGREWLDHPNHFKGNSALPLVSANGEDNHDLEGAMMLCPRTDKMPYLMQVLAGLNTSIGRCRMMRLAAGASVPMHCDTNLYWRQRVRIHIPIVTNDSVVFESGGQRQHLACGEAWVIDTWHNHSVTNNGAERIHLVVDTLGSNDFWRMLKTQSWIPNTNSSKPPQSFLDALIKVVDSKPKRESSLVFEESRTQAVIEPKDIDTIVSGYLVDINRSDHSDFNKIEAILVGLIRNWATVWDSFGSAPEQHVRYRMLVLSAIQQLEACEKVPKLRVNGQSVVKLLEQLVIKLDQFEIVSKKDQVSIKNPSPKKIAKVENSEYMQRPFSPIFIVAAPRSGSTLLYETLGLHEDLMHYDSESHSIFESINSLSVNLNGSNVLSAEHANESISSNLKQQFFNRLDRQELEQKQEIIFLEKTPKNALRVDFLKAAFPTSRFIYLYRKPEGNLSSIIEGWKSQRFITYKNLPKWDSTHKWSFLLPNGWQGLPRDDLAAISAFQYQSANKSILDSLVKHEEACAFAVSYEGLVNNPRETLKRICLFLGVSWSPNFDKQLDRKDGLKLSKYTLDEPNENKWLQNKELMEAVLPNVQHYYNQTIIPSTKIINLSFDIE